MLSVITRVMIVRDQTSSAFVTNSSPLCDRSCKFVHGPENVKSTNADQIQAFQDSLRAHFGQFSNRLQFLFLEVMVVENMGLRLCTNKCSVFLFASSHDLSTQIFACPSISYDHATVFARDFSHPGNCSVAPFPADIRDSNICLYSSTILSFALHSR